MILQSSKGSTASAANTRSKFGCLTCRGRKVKCDEAKPGCLMCTRLRLRCDYASEDQTECLHDRRVGAGSIKKRQYTNWRPQQIESKALLAATAASAASATSPGPSVSIPSTISSLPSPSVSATPPFLETTSSSNSMAAIPTPASGYTEFRLEDQALLQNTGSDMAACGRITAGNVATHTVSTIADAGLDFSSFVHEDLLAAGNIMRTPSPFSYLPARDDTDYLFFGGGVAAPLSQQLPSATSALGASLCAPTPIAVEEDLTKTDARNSGSYKTSSTFHLLSTFSPSPLTGLILGTTTIVLTSFPSRVRLTERDYEALLLFHQQVGFSIGSKSPIWSTHAILIKLAVHHSAILHFLLAASFSELHWRWTADNSSGSDGSSFNSSGSLAGLTGFPGTTTTPGQLARRHYEAGEAALSELAAAPHDDANAGLYHVVVVACFWLEYLIHRRHMPQHGRWTSNVEFSRAMGDYVRRYRLRRALMGKERPQFSSALCSSSSFSPNPPLPPPKCGRGDEGDEPSSDEEEEGEEQSETGSAFNSNDDGSSVKTIHTSATTAAATAASVVLARPMPPAKYRSFLSRLLSWLYWSDCAACFFGKGGGLAMQFRKLPRSQLGLYETARTTLLDFWDDYTPEEIADDNQNWPALQLINETWVAVHRLNLVYEAEEEEEAAAAGSKTQHRSRYFFSPSSPPYSETVGAIARDTRALRNRHTTVFRLSAFAATSGGYRSRLLAMADWAVCHYLALELHLLRAGASREDLYGEKIEMEMEMENDGKRETDSHTAVAGAGMDDGYIHRPLGGLGPSSHSQVIAAQIVHLAERAIRMVGPVELDRFQWPLFWAGVETDNYVYRYFVMANLINADFRAALHVVVQEQQQQQLEGEKGGEGIGYTPGADVSIGRLRAICRTAGMTT